MKGVSAVPSHRCRCPRCRRDYAVDESGKFLGSGLVCTLGVAVMPRTPWLGLGIALTGLVFSEQIDRFLRYRCPECGTALQLVTAALR